MEHFLYVICLSLAQIFFAAHEKFLGLPPRTFLLKTEAIEFFIQFRNTDFRIREYINMDHILDYGILTLE